MATKSYARLCRWVGMLYSLHDWVPGRYAEVPHRVPGCDPEEWLALARVGGYDWVDRMYIDAETIGG